MELVEPAFKERAISWVLAGGILGAVVGPNLANWTRNALPQPFAGAYLAACTALYEHAKLICTPTPEG